VGFVVDKVAAVGFPCQSSFHRLLHNHHHLSSGASTIGQVATVPTKNNNNKKYYPKTEVDTVDILVYQPLKTSLNGTLPPLQQHSKGSKVAAVAVYLIFKSSLGILLNKIHSLVKIKHK
jgi:hypothetical protein